MIKVCIKNQSDKYLGVNLYPLLVRRICKANLSDPKDRPIYYQISKRRPHVELPESHR
jgi:hypothetical protein